MPSVALASAADDPGISSWCVSDPLEVTSTVRAIARSVTASSGVSASDRLRNTPAGRVAPACRRAGLDERADLVLHFLAVAVAELVEEHQVEGEALQAAVLVRLEGLAHHAVIAFLVDDDQQDRQVAGDAVPPQRVARLPVARDRVGLPEPRVGKAQARGQPLNRIGLAVVEVEVPQLGVAVPAGQGERRGPRPAGRGTSR